MTAKLLMCAPTHFEINYEINPWMRGQVNSGNRSAAAHQWAALERALGEVAEVELIDAEAGWPDMVFVANAGLIIDDSVVVARFAHRERQGESPYFSQWFAQQGFNVLDWPSDVVFEGAGDALLDRGRPLLWLGYGHRSQRAAAVELASRFDIEVQPLRLVDPRFYHLDTCLCPLAGGELLYFPAAFDAAALRAICARVPARLRIEVSASDALHFACNAVSIGTRIVMNRASPNLVRRLAARGYQVDQRPLSEFMRAGGSAKCLTLRLDEPMRQLARAVA